MTGVYLQADSEDGQLLRQQLSGLTRDLRLCTLTGDEFCGEVATTGVLTGDEICTVCKSVGSKKKAEGLTEICDKIIPWKKLHRKKTVQDELSLSNFKKAVNYYNNCNYNMTLLTKKNTIELLPLVCRSRDCSNTEPENHTHKVDYTITITEVAKPHHSESSSASGPLITVSFSGNVKCGVNFEIPLVVDERNVTLRLNTKYTVNMMLIGDHWQYGSQNSRSGDYGNDHLTLAITKRNMWYEFPSTKLQYRATAVE